MGWVWGMGDMGGGVVCFDGTGVRVEFVTGRFAAGETIEELARDYALTPRDIEAGLRLVVSGAFSSQGLRVVVARAMEEQIPLLPARAVQTSAQRRPAFPANRIRREGCFQPGNCDEHPHGIGRVVAWLLGR